VFNLAHAVREANQNQKGGKLEGGALTQEALQSSKSVLEKNQFGNGTKGLQQFYTPPQAAKLVADVVGRYVNVLDPTAGDGSLLREFDPGYSWGVEIDEDQIKNSEGSYKAIRGDIQHVYPLLRRVVDDWGAIVANPPFGLSWEEPTYKDGQPVNSTKLAFFYCMQILAYDGQLAFIAGRDRFYKEIIGEPMARGIYAVVECDDLFEGTTLPCVIAFGINPEMRGDWKAEDGSGYVKRECPRDMLDLLASWVTDHRKLALKPYERVAQRDYESHKRQTAWKAVQEEYERRVEGRIKKREFDVQLVGGKVLQVMPSSFAAAALQKTHRLHDVNRMNNHSVNYFANNEREWNVLLGLAKSDILTIDPRAFDAVEEALMEFKRIICPLYPIKPQQRLGYLSDIDTIECIKTDEERGFLEGERYDIRSQTQTIRTQESRAVQIRSGKNAGEWEERTFETAAKVMKVTIGHWSFTDSSGDSEHIQYLIDHFDLPDPGDVGTKYPEETERMRKIVREVEKEMLVHSKAYEAKFPEAKKFKGFRKFQIEDMARMLVKGAGLLAWEQGLGKTLGGITYAECCIKLGAQNAALFIVPKDLIPQWQREAERFLGLELELIKTHGEAHAIAKKLKMGGSGRFITYYEALSIVGTSKSEMLPEVVVEQKTDFKKIAGTGRYVHVVDESQAKALGIEEDQIEAYVGHTRYVPEQWQEVTKDITSKELCPECKSDRRSGWNGKFCRAEKTSGGQCGYSHYKHRVKPMGSKLSTAFKHGVAIVDEATMIQGDYSTRSEVIRGINARFKLSMTGTPIKNYVPQAFWPLWWCLGNNSRLFPYGYNDKSQFEDDFAVIEWKHDGRGRKQNRKVLPEVTNLSRLWRMLSSSTIRRRKEETGEKIVPRTFHPITVPLGIQQQRISQKWLQSFHLFFEDKYPDSKVVKAGMHEIMAPMLGMQQKLDYAATIPEADPDHEWTGISVSNWTPANLKVLELCMALAKQGRKVLVGSNLVATSRFLADQLCERDVKALHVLDGNNQTQNPDKRAKTVYAFQTNEVQVLCTGVQAIRLGHNLDAGSAVVLHGLPWDFESLDQFIARVHRLTSEKDVDVYIVIPKGTLTAKKYENLSLKGQAAELALDGRLIEKKEESVDEAAIIKELIDKGIPITGEEVDETDVEESWKRVPVLADFEIPKDLNVKVEETMSLPTEEDDKQGEAPVEPTPEEPPSPSAAASATEESAPPEPEDPAASPARACAYNIVLPSGATADSPLSGICNLEVQTPVDELPAEITWEDEVGFEATEDNPDPAAETVEIDPEDLKPKEGEDSLAFLARMRELANAQLEEKEVLADEAGQLGLFGEEGM